MHKWSALVTRLNVLLRSPRFVLLVSSSIKGNDACDSTNSGNSARHHRIRHRYIRWCVDGLEGMVSNAPAVAC